MNQYPRRKVVEWIEHLNYGPNRHLFPVRRSARLECGHVVHVGVSNMRPLKMACYECEPQTSEL